MMSLDLSVLEESLVGVTPGTELTGKPMELALADIEEDPNQPRKEFSSEAMADITASIRERGVKSPVSVRPHPQKPRKWLLNFGARRYRGSVAAGKETIPAFIDESHSDYDQVIENTQRDNLRPIELALFIQRKLDAGASKAEVARGLSLEKSVITFHLALIDAPVVVEEAYRSGRCTSPRTLYELRLLHETNPRLVEAWCTSAEEITRRDVARLAASLKPGDNNLASKQDGVSTSASATAPKVDSAVHGHGPSSRAVISPLVASDVDSGVLDDVLELAEALCNDVTALVGLLGSKSAASVLYEASRNAANAQFELNQLRKVLRSLREVTPTTAESG
jgi:ParB family transcriptional regulator, chromosome partitioning protein